MRDRPTPTGPDDLALTALRFAAGELSADQTEAFAERMAYDQAARDALADAIRLSAAALGQSAPTPDLLFREAVKDDLRPTVWSRLVRRRPYRGHPAAWAGLGGVAAAGLTAFGVWLADPPARVEPVQAGGSTPALRPDVAIAPAPRPVAERLAVEIAPPPSPVETREAPTTVAIQPRPQPLTEPVSTSPRPEPKASDVVGAVEP